MGQLALGIHELLLERGERVAVAESCTGGRVCAALTAVEGVSKTFCGGVIAYQRAVKVKTLGVDLGILRKFGQASVEVALAMAVGVARGLEANWGVATTGICGPGGGSEACPLGCVCFAIVYDDWRAGYSDYVKLWSEKHQFKYESRIQVQREASQYALRKLDSLIRGGF